MHTQIESERVNRQLDRIGWSLAAILTGSALLWQAPLGFWLLGAGVILLGMNAIRLVLHIPMSNLTLILGLTALTMGGAFSQGANPLLIPRLLIIIGVVKLFKTLSRQQVVD